MLMLSQPGYPLNFYFKKLRFEPLLMWSVSNFFLGIWGVVRFVYADFNLEEIGYFQFALNFAFIWLGVIFARVYYFKRNRKYPDLQIEEDGFFIWTNFKQDKKVHFWWDTIDSLEKKDFTKNIAIVYTINYTIEHDTGLYDGHEREYSLKGFNNQIEIALAIVYSYNQYKKRENQHSEAIKALQNQL